MIAAQTLSQLPTALFVISLILLHVFVLGYWAMRSLGVRAINLWSQIALTGASGLALLGTEMFALGYVHGWNRPVLCLSGLLMLGGLYAARSALPNFLIDLRAELQALYLSHRFLFVSCALMLAAVILSGLRPTSRMDEFVYHWPAPQQWARAGEWIPSRYQLMNGPAFMEVLFTITAIFTSAPTAAHWTHTLCFIFLACAGAGLAQACLGRPVAAFAGILACPVLTTQAVIAYNDDAGAMFCVAAYVALLCANADLDKISRRTILLCGLLFAATFSVKAFMLAALPAALVLAARKPAAEPGRAAERFGTTMQRVALLIGPLALTVAIWTTHCYALSGHLTDSRHIFFLHDRNEPNPYPGNEVGRIPHPTDLLITLFIPIFSSVLGHREPWGGRTGLLIVPFAPVGIYALRRLPKGPRLRAVWLLAGAVSSFLLLGLITEKTRYHAFVWPALLVIAAVGYGYLQDHASARVARFSAAAFALLAALGMADAAHVVLRGIRALP